MPGYKREFVSAGRSAMKGGSAMSNDMGDMSDSGNELEFVPPDDLDLQGKSGEATVRWSKKPDGNVCITHFNGVKVGSGDYGDEESSEPSDMMENSATPTDPA
jgi:hypothetical protein